RVDVDGRLGLGVPGSHAEVGPAIVVGIDRLEPFAAGGELANLLPCEGVLVETHPGPGRVGTVREDLSIAADGGERTIGPGVGRLKEAQAVAPVALNLGTGDGPEHEARRRPRPDVETRSAGRLNLARRGQYLGNTVMVQVAHSELVDIADPELNEVPQARGDF